jgi:hypothetical protein
MQRVRIGLTGLAFVFMLVMLATIVVRPSAEAPLTANLIEQQKTGSQPVGGNAAATVVAEPQEPLAELGVAPGNAESNNSVAAPAQPAPARQQP